MNIIFNFLSNLLNCTFNITGDWGTAIVLLTVIIRAVLLPMSLKQRISMLKQQDLAKEMDEIKIKYKNNKKKMEEELQGYYKESAKGMLGCLLTFIQLPIIASLYSVIIKLPVEASTMIVPWVASIKLSDSHMILPMAYMLMSMSLSLINHIDYFKLEKQIKVNKLNTIIMGIFSVLISLKAPIAIGIYFITGSLFSLIEEIVFRLYVKNKKFA